MGNNSIIDCNNMLKLCLLPEKKNSPALAADAIETRKPVVEEKYRKSNVSMEECHRLADELDMLMQEKDCMLTLI